MIIVKGGVTAPNGFLANGVKADIKKSGRRDLALLYSEVPAAAAGSFTTNRFQASPVNISKLHLNNKTHQAIIVNSGNANCMNGKRGDRDAEAMAGLAAEAMSLSRKEVLVASTGIIGRYLPVEKIVSNMPLLAKGISKDNGSYFAEAIMTTDTKKKELAVKVKLGGSIVIIGGACKGVGMIYPDMKTERHATMLAFMATDVSISKKMLEGALAEAVKGSFNMVSVDGDMSTNDSCFILANGLAGNVRIDKKGKDYNIFIDALKYLTKNLAMMLAEDGEGASKFVEIKVDGAKTEDDAKTIARKISASNLLKCCIFGEDPNWGRIAAACGASGVLFDPNRVDIILGPPAHKGISRRRAGDVKVLSNGGRVKDYNKSKAQVLFKKKDINIKVDLKSGRHSATAWTCDFSKEYVEINSEYST